MKLEKLAHFPGELTFLVKWSPGVTALNNEIWARRRNWMQIHMHFNDFLVKLWYIMPPPYIFQYKANAVHCKQAFIIVNDVA